LWKESETSEYILNTHGKGLEGKPSEVSPKRGKTDQEPGCPELGIKGL
jgi:hypothetical protein